MSTVTSLKVLSEREDRYVEGHRLCAGCAEPIIARQILMATEKPVVVSNATGCFEVSSSIYPFTSWNVPWIHSAFENAAATISGVEAAYLSLKRQGKITEDIRFITFGGDGATYDIGFQAISGAIERGHRFMYVCLNNEAYMNTGIQRSGATSRGAQTTTCPAGTCIPGKREFPKDLTKIIIAHDLPYAAQASPHNYKDMIEKSAKGFEANGPAFLNVISPCPRGWRHDSAKTIEIAKLAVETCVWPLYEFERGEWRLTGESLRIAEGSRQKLPVSDWLKSQGRFGHLTKEKWKFVADEIQANVDSKWQELLRLCKH
ncbi:MAG: thiamine pyrophosphate-dependent enzyme [Methanomassiliicoccales archaeon]|jgi:pyruvate ferredoxin oxidoreductase beta subunit|nr:thiamine pyrophosphate-dependent enzyme [Methanomassiliicoccales archaeon]MDD1756298.1 thiamine pyrophosphate-dependent enzyme [Methanomassiliicoccales archaeon]